MSTRKIKWQSVKTVENLYKNEESGRFYVRLYFSQGGKSHSTFKSLRTDKISIAKQRIRDALSEHEARRAKPGTLANSECTWAELSKSYRQHFQNSSDISPLTKESREVAIKRLEKSWPKLKTKKVRLLSEAECKEWLNRFRSKATAKAPPGSKGSPKSFSASSINKTIDALSLCLEHGKEAGLIKYNVAKGLTRSPTQTRKVTELPSIAEFHRFLEELQFPSNANTVRAIREMDTANKTQKQMAEEMGVSLATFKRHLQRFKSSTDNEAGSNKDTADFARLMAFTGMRVGEACQIQWKHVFWDKNLIQIPGTKTTSSERIIPLIPAARDFLTALKTLRTEDTDDDYISRRKSIQTAIDGACKRSGIKRITHHDLRHYFATVCIESGVDIPTVSRWLGHNDGGALAMKTYGHLRDEHSQAAALKVNF